ncbi:MAG: hypothetical protein IPJ41_06195 [Phycisphaerales bacterium]|nr:hypothetical protein [Phycisphaerales bacterium]
MRRHRQEQSFELLEQRHVLSFSWSSEEVYLVELVNRARADPQAEALRTGVDLTADLSTDELYNLKPSEPLALQEALTLAARQHSQDMSDRNFFDHQNPDGDRAQQRAEKNGYDGSAGENIAAGYDTIDETHVAWLESVEHRKNVLSLWSTFSNTFHYDEIGVGFFFPGYGVSDYHTYYTEVFGFSGRPPRTYILGVVYDDTNSNDFYSVGEGRADVRVDVTNASSGAFVGSYTTDEAGNYQIVVPGGQYVVSFVDTATGLGKQQLVTVTTNTNVKVDATGDELTHAIAPTDNIAAVGAAINGSATGDGKITVTTINGSGKPIAFHEDGSGGWDVVDLQTLTGSPALTGQIETWTDAKDGASYAAATSADGLLLFRRNGSGVWSYRNLNNELNGAGLLSGDLTVFANRSDRVYIAGLDASGNLHLFRQTDTENANGYAWTSRNLSNTDLEDQGQTTPQFSGRLTSFVTSWNALNIVGLDTNGDIQAVWISGGMARWRLSNLSDSTGAPALSGGLTVYLTSWKAINLVGTDAAGHVSATWWVPSFGAAWVTSDLTTIIGGPELAASSMTSFVTSWGATNIAGVDINGNLVVYWWAKDNGWSISTLTDVIAGSELPTGRLSGLTVSKTKSINLLARAEDGGVLRYWWKPGGSWAMQNLTDLTA